MMNLSSIKTISQFIYSAGTIFPDRTVVCSRVKTKYAEVNWKKFLAMVFRMAAYLHRRGIRRGDSVALFSDNTLEFWVTDFACQICGAVSVIVHPLFSENAIINIIKKSAAMICLAGGHNSKRIFDLRAEIPRLREIIAVDKAPKSRYVIPFSEALESVDVPVENRLLKMVNSVRPDDISVVYWGPLDTELTPAAYTHEAVINSLSELSVRQICPDDRTFSLSMSPHVDYCGKLIGVYMAIMTGTPFVISTDIDDILISLPELGSVTLTGALSLFSSYYAYLANVKNRFFSRKPLHTFVYNEAVRGGILSRFFRNIDRTFLRQHYIGNSGVDFIRKGICWGSSDSFPLFSISSEFGIPVHRLFSLPLGPPSGVFGEKLDLFKNDIGNSILPGNYSKDISRGYSYRTYVTRILSSSEKAGEQYETPFIYAGQYILPSRYFEETIMKNRIIKRAVMVSHGGVSAVLVVPDGSLASVKLKPETVNSRIEEVLEDSVSRFIWKIPLKRFAVLGQEFSDLSRDEIVNQCRITIQKMLLPVKSERTAKSVSKQ